MIVKGMFKCCGGLGCGLNSHSPTYCNYTFWGEEWILPSPFFVRCFLGAFLKFRKVSVSFVLSVQPSAWNSSALTERIFMKFSIWIFFQNLSRKFKFQSNLTEKWALYMKTNVHFCSYLGHFLEWEMLCSITFFRQAWRVWNNVEKYCRARQATDENMAHAHCLVDAEGYKYTLKICNSYCSPTATVVARTLLNVVLYVQVHCQSWFIL